MNYFVKSAAIALAVMQCLSASAEISQDEAKRLGNALTAWGAEKAGNKDGSIPAYTGGLTTPPASYNPAQPGVLTDPFADEKPLFSVTAANVAQYADKVSDGMRAILTKYPETRIDVYPSRRTAAYPKFFVDSTIKNATQCKLDESDNKLVNCVGGLPFPIPKTGAQVMWNKKLSFVGASYAQRGSTTFVDASGKAIVMGVNDSWFDFPYYSPNNIGNNTRIYERFRYDFQEPARVQGEKFLTHMKPDDSPSQVWQYLPGQRRTKLSPDLAYDTPHPQSGGVAGMDQSFGFMGPLDRFDFKLVGKKEMLIPYNNYKIFSSECSFDKYFKKNFPNPECIRWELHRVWVVEGTLKQGKRHIFSKRVSYLDEDSYAAGLVDYYDMSGKIYRATVQFGVPLYHDKELGFSGNNYLSLDLQTGRYIMDNYQSPFPPIKGYAPVSSKLPEREWQPEALSGGAIR